MQHKTQECPPHIVITGASSGIGEALALQYAVPGTMLSLSGRCAERLESVAAQCGAKGADVQASRVEVTDRAAMQGWLLSCDARRPITLLVANAGISGGTQGVMNGEDPAQVRRIFDINVTGVFNTIEPVLPLMRARRLGQIAIMSSLAGFCGWAGAPAYCSSKAAVRVYGESLGASLKGTGISVHVICPGFVVSRMTAVNDFPMPFLMSADRAAKIIVRSIRRGKSRIAFPLLPYAFVRVLEVLPSGLLSLVQSAAPGKPPIKTDG